MTLYLTCVPDVQVTSGVHLLLRKPQGHLSLIVYLILLYCCVYSNLCIYLSPSLSVSHTTLISSVVVAEST
jgi:hypothetical protein